MPYLTRRAFLGSAAAAGLAVLPAIASGKGDLKFLVIGDWGYAQSSSLKDVALAMERTAQVQGPAFVVTTGDNFYPAGVTGVDDPLWHDVFEKEFPASAFPIPWYPVLGNHDWRGDVQAQIDYGKVNPRWRLPACYYTHVEGLPAGGSVEFFHLDTQSLVHPSISQALFDDQLAWLNAALSRSAADWKIVVGHHTIYSGGGHGDTPRLARWLAPMFKAHGVHIYLNGHDHSLQHVVVDGVNYITCGSAAKLGDVHDIEGTAYDARSAGFGLVAMTLEEFRLNFIGRDGVSLYGTTIRREA